MSPADIAASALRVSASDVVAVEPIKHGLTNESWLVRTRSDAVVVRISASSDDALRIDRPSEARVLAIVASAGVGAPVIRSDPERRLLVTRYAGPSWSYEEAREHANIVRAAALLVRLHRLDAPGVRTVDLAATIEGYLSTLTLAGAGGDLTRQSLRERAHEAANVLRRDAATRLCHNDVHHLNIVGGDELRLIDWEYAGVGEPLFDLAALCVYHGYERTRRELLLTSYSADAGPDRESRLDQALWLFEYIRELWTAVREQCEV
jgi:aminoglycoside phosphotransferase (APT) family kinase protein